MKCGAKVHIAVEGCVGVGKTTLASLLAKARGSTLVLEQFEKNPFLEEFYSNPAGNALETEMQFLLLHYHQLKNIGKMGKRETISDFTFYKNTVFAQMNLAEKSENRAFEDLYQFLLSKLSPPNLIIYLKGTDDLIVERIRRRNRKIEAESEMGYFKKLNSQYEAYFHRYDGMIYYVEADNFDGLNQPQQVAELSKAVDSALSSKIPKPMPTSRKTKNLNRA